MSNIAKAKYFILISVVNLVSYFLIQSFVTNHEISFMTEIDYAIPFMPEYIWIYHTILPVFGFTLILLVKKRKVFFNTLWASILATIVLSTAFIVFPSFYPRNEFVANTISEKLVLLTRSIDAPHNTFPSNHVTFAWILFWGSYYSKISKEVLGVRSLYFVWAVGVSFSTVALKQHYVVDVAAGFILATLIYHFTKSVISHYNLYNDYNEAYL